VPGFHPVALYAFGDRDGHDDIETTTALMRAGLLEKPSVAKDCFHQP
jgi:hypothetical protein